MFALQVAVMKGRGGVFTSLFHYARMFDQVGVGSLCLYRGPAGEPLRAGGVNALDAPPSLTSPLFAFTPDLGRLRRAVRAQSGGGDPDFAMVHSDKALRAIRRAFPQTIIMTRCHSDKTKRKRDADIVVTLNPAQHEMVTHALEGSRARTYMLGHPFMMETAPRPLAAEGPVRLNYVARFTAAKDPMTFVRALSAMATKPLPPIRMIGDGPLQEEIKAAVAAAGLQVEFTGWRPKPFADFSRNDILVLPSTWEGLPWLLLEAQARGVPTVASDISGNKLALGDGAYGEIFPTGDPAALAAALDTALAHLDALRHRAEEGRAALPNRFGPQAFWNGLRSAMADVKERRARNA